MHLSALWLKSVGEDTPKLTGSATHAICSEFGFLFSESNNKVDKKRLMFALWGGLSASV